MRITLNKFEISVMKDERIELIEARYGAIGFAIIIKLLSRIYGTGGYFCPWSNDLVGIFARGSGVDAKAVSDVVAYALTVGLFDGEMFSRHSILTSADIQAQYFRAVSRRSGVVYDPDYVIGDFYKSCRRALPLRHAVSGGAVAELPTKDHADGNISDSAATAVTVEEASSGEAERKAKVVPFKGSDPIMEMRNKRMFARGKTVSLSELVEMTGASTLVPPEVMDQVTASEVCTAEDTMIAMMDKDREREASELVDAVEKAVKAEEAEKVEEAVKVATVEEAENVAQIGNSPSGDEPSENANGTAETAATVEEASVKDAMNGEKEPSDTPNDGRFVRDRKKPRRDKVYGRYFNVLLDDDEYRDLMQRIPNADDYIQRLSRRLIGGDFKCESAYVAIVDCYRKELSRRVG